MLNILVAGLAVVDLVFEVAQLPEHAEKYVATNAQLVGGGGAANAAVALARLNTHPLLLARVGDDSFGQTIRDELLACDVDCQLLQTTSNARSSFSSVLVDQAGERQIVNFRGDGLSAHVPPVDQLKVHAVLADTRWPEATEAVLKLARTLGVPGVLDAEAPVSDAAVRLASHVAFSAQGLQSYSGVSNLTEGLLRVARDVDSFVCVTNGDKGVLFVDNDKVCRNAACAVTAVDTLGAGDVWHAAFVYQLAAGEYEAQAMSFANAAAAIKCTRKGGGRKSPTLDEVRTFMKDRGFR